MAEGDENSNSISSLINKLQKKKFNIFNELRNHIIYDTLIVGDIKINNN